MNGSRCTRRPSDSSVISWPPSPPRRDHARSREITRDHSRSLVGGSHSAEVCAAAPPSPRRVPCHAGRARGACYPRRSGGDCRCARAGEEEVMAERARAAARVRVGRRSGGQRGPRRRQLGAGGGGGLIGSPAVFLTDARRLCAITRAGATASHYVGRLACCAALSYHFTSDSVLCDPRRTSGARRRDEKRRAGEPNRENGV